jgi:hypothetical protein
MKYLLTILITLSAIILCLSCRPTSRLIPNPDSEAQDQAEKFVSAQLTRCGDSYYGIRKVANDNGLYQFKNPKISVKSQELNQADKLDGIQWKGSSNFSADAWRMYSVTGEWTPWRQGFTALDIGLSVNMYKKNSQWQFGATGELKPDSYEKVDCSKLPQ